MIGSIEAHKKIIKALGRTLIIIRKGTSQIKLEKKLELQMINVFRKHSKMFWEQESKNDILNKCYIQAQKDLSEIKKMGMSENPEERLSFIQGLTSDWNEQVKNDKTEEEVLKSNYKDAYNFTGQEVLNEFKIKETFELRSLDFLKALSERANLTSEQIDQTSWELLQNKIADSFWKEGNNVEQVARDIRGLFEETYKGRAENIARTETGEIVSEAQFTAYDKMGIPELEWMAEPDACELCAPLDGKIVKLGELFDNGDGWTGERPLVHPSCHCDVAAVVPDEYVPSDAWLGN